MTPLSRAGRRRLGRPRGAGRRRELILINDNSGENRDGAAFVISLPPGIYTVHASGVGGGTGVALVELYLLE